MSLNALVGALENHLAWRNQRPLRGRALHEAYRREDERREFRRRRLLRPVAVRLIRALRDVRRAQAGLILAEGDVLSRLKNGRRFQDLGHVRFSDCVHEVLHLHPRTARRRITVHRLLAEFPALREPFLSGSIGASQVLALRPVLLPENAVLWAGLAQRLSLEQLKDQVRRAHDARAPNTDRDDTASDDAPRRRIRFLAPQSPGLAIEHGLETAQRVLGWEAPRDDCLAAILAEGASSLDLPSEPPPDGPTLPAEPVPELPVRLPRTRLPRKDSVWYQRKDLKRARRLLAKVDRTLHRTPECPRIPEGPRTPKTLSAVRLVDRHRDIARLKNPLRVLEARLVYYFFLLGVGAILQSEDHTAACAQILGVSRRTVMNLATAGCAFESCHALADAYLQGRIGLTHVFVLQDPMQPEARDWVRRAKQTTLRQFRREVRLLKRLEQTLGCVSGVLPIHRLEDTLVRRLVGRGWTAGELESELASRGLVYPPEASHDPAENPVAMARLETLVDILVIEASDPEDRWRLPGKTVSVPGRHLPIVIWSKPPIWTQWHAVLSHVRGLCGNLPPWAVATLLVKAALDEWLRIDPGRIPTEAAILERDDYRCRAPGCTARKHLEVHHIVFRSQGGSETPDNLITLCHAHHHHAVHRGTLRITGEAPHALVWEFGSRRYLGERRVQRPPYPITRTEPPRSTTPVRTRGRRTAGFLHPPPAAPAGTPSSPTTCFRAQPAPPVTPPSPPP